MCALSAPAESRPLLSGAALLAIYMQAVNISLPNAAVLHIHGSLSMTDDDIGWVFSSYIMASAMVMPMTRWLGRPPTGAPSPTSGRSANVLAAARVARTLGVQVVALTGRLGGDLAGLADVAIRVPADATDEVQERHLPVYHALCTAVETSLFSA